MINASVITQRQAALLSVDKHWVLRPLSPEIRDWLALPDDLEDDISLLTLFPLLSENVERVTQMQRVQTFTAVSPAWRNGHVSYTLQIEPDAVTTGWLVTVIRESSPAAARPTNNLAELSARYRTLSLLNQAGQALIDTLAMQDVLERLLQVAIEIIGAEGSSVWLYDEVDATKLVCRAAYHQSHDPQLLGQRLTLGQGVAGWAAETGHSTIVNRTRNDQRFFPEIDARSGFHTQSLLAVPLVCRQHSLGVLEVVNKIADDFHDDDLAVAETLAAFAAIAIDNARLVAQLQDQTTDLEARNDELDAFAHTVAHDLQNPLSLISGFADLVIRDDREDILPPHEREKALNNIIKSVHRMSNIVQELLLLSSVRKTDVERRPVQMREIVESALERVTHMVAERNGRIIITDNWPTAMGHAPWLEEVWENLISNALKYGGRPPEVTVGAHRLDNGLISFWVRDNGEGISMQDTAQLFSPFTQLKSLNVSGHGLGLSIVRRIVDKLGGEVSVSSRVGRGSEFRFTLPPAD